MAGFATGARNGLVWKLDVCCDILAGVYAALIWSSSGAMPTPSSPLQQIPLGVCHCQLPVSCCLALLCWRTYHRLLSEAGASSAGASVQKVGFTVSFLCLQFISLGCLLGVAVAQGTWPRVRSGSPEYHTAMTRCRLAQRGAAVFCPAGQAPQQIAAVCSMPPQHCGAVVGGVNHTIPLRGLAPPLLKNQNIHRNTSAHSPAPAVMLLHADWPGAGRGLARAFCQAGISKWKACWCSVVSVVCVAWLFNVVV